MSRVELKQTISKTFSIFRQLFADDHEQLKKIDETYEREVLKELDIIPEEYIGDVMKGIEVVKVVLLSINYKQISNALAKLPFECSVKVDVFKFVVGVLEEQLKDVKTRHGISALLRKYKPLIDCFTIALGNPRKYLEIAAHFNDTSTDSIFEGI